ncbi:MAG TPA: hypothetical protein PL135_01210 [Spirochaetota bacterium]|nr:hypothetical protein [Spirochaetota bacterium]
MRVRYLAAVASILLILSAASKAAGGDPASYEARVFSAFAAGDYYALYEAIESLLMEHPGSPEAALYLSDLVTLADVYGRARVEDSLSRIAARLNEEKPEHAGLYGLGILLQRERLARRYSPGALAGIVKELRPISKWMVSGPYHRYGAGDIDHPFLPEIAPPATGEVARWKRVSADPKQGEIDFARVLAPGRGVAYAATAIGPGRPVRLRIYSSCPYRLYLNGRLALANVERAARRSSRVVELKAEGAVALMIKLYREDDWKFRAIVTDLNDVPIDTETIPMNSPTGSCEFTEVMDYPYAELVRRLHGKERGALFHLGSFFSERESREAEKYFRLGIGSEAGFPCRYFLAESLLGASGNDRGTAEYMEAALIYRELSDSDAAFMPARYRRLQNLIDRQSMAEAFVEGRRLTEEAPRFLPLRVLYSSMLAGLGYEREFEQDSEALIKEFPSSSSPAKIIASFNAKRDPARSARLYHKAIETEFDKNALEALIRILRGMGRHSEIVDLVERFDHFHEYDNERIDALIEMGEYERASGLLLESIAVKEDPEYYLRLGMISYLEGEAPSLYWGKMLAISPSLFLMGDLLDYVTGLGPDYPLSREREEKGEDYIDRWVRGGIKPSGAPSEVLFRQRVYRLNRDGSGRVFCEDVIYVHDSRGIERYGEFRLDHGSRVYPLRARVYREGGGYSDAGRIVRVDGSSFLSLPSLGERSIIHVSYYADNPFSLRGDSVFFATPLLEVHDFDEALGVFSCRVTVPEDMDVRVVFTGGPVSKRRRDGGMEYSMRIENRAPVRVEKAMGNRLNYLPIYAISTMCDKKDFVRWYNSLIRGSSDLRADDIRSKFGSRDVRDTIRAVYEYVSREIDTLGNVLYYPDSAAATMMKKRGTPEDKAVLSRAILECLGIRSYIAFAAERDFPDLGGFVSPAGFTHALLFVPIDRHRGVWMDYSRSYNGFGVVVPALEGADALVVIRDYAEIRTIAGSRMDGSRIDLDVRLEDGGNAVFRGRVSFHGGREGLRSLFFNADTREEMINRLLGRMFPAFSLDDFQMEGLDSVDGPFDLRISGRAFAITATTPDRIILTPVLNESEALGLADERARTHPYRIIRPVNESERYRFRLPDGYRKAAIEREDSLKSRFGYASIRASKAAGETELVVEKEVHVGAARIEPADYGEFVDFCEGIQRAERRYVIIEKTE